MKTLKKILIVADLDDSSLHVLEYGMTLGLMFGAQLKCVYVRVPNSIMTVGQDESYPYSIEGIGLPTRNEETRLYDLDTLQSLVSVINKRLDYNDINVESEVIIGHTIETILLESNTWEADLIVLGMFTDQKRSNQAPVPQEIITKTKTNVIIIPTTYCNRNLDKIGIFINFQFEEISMILNMINIARENKLELELIYSMEKKEQIQEVKKKLNIYHQLFDKDIRNGMIGFKLSLLDIRDIIFETTKDDRIDLFVTPSIKRTWPLFIPGREYEMLNYIEVPMLVWKES